MVPMSVSSAQLQGFTSLAGNANNWMNMAGVPMMPNGNVSVPGIPSISAADIGTFSNPASGLVQSPQVALPGTTGGFFGNGQNLGANMPTIGLALGGLQTLGNIWGAWQANKLAKSQFKFAKDFANTNLENSMKSYNTALFDRARSRAVMESQSDSERDAYYEENKLERDNG
jgi:hypothetical protein